MIDSKVSTWGIEHSWNRVKIANLKSMAEAVVKWPLSVKACPTQTNKHVETQATRKVSLFKILTQSWRKMTFDYWLSFMLFIKYKSKFTVTNNFTIFYPLQLCISFLFFRQYYCRTSWPRKTHMRWQCLRTKLLTEHNLENKLIFTYSYSCR